MSNAANPGGRATVDLIVDGPIATVWLNRPVARNAIDLQLTRDLRDIAFELEARHDLRVVVLRGRGAQFCAGGDIGMFRDNLESMQHFIKDVIANFHDAVLTLRRMPKATVAVVHGAVAGGGLSLALGCDFVIAEQNTKFAVAYRKLGATADGGMTHLLSRLLGQRRALELMLLSEAFSAADALAMNLVNQVVPEQDLEDAIERMSAMLADNSRSAVGAVKQLVYGAPTASFEEQLAREMTAFAQCAATADFREGVLAFLQRRKPNFVGQDMQ